MVLSLDRWVGKVAVVTGASSGIGAAIVKLLVEQGLTVVGLARRSETIDKHAEQLSSKRGKLYGIKTDMSKEEDILQAFKWIGKNLGHVQILINNAGVFKRSSLSKGETKAWKVTFDVNVLGLCVATREAVKIMTNNKIGGHIIHINSLTSHDASCFPGGNAYIASKHAVTALAETLRHELTAQGSSIKITSLSPGLVATEMTTLNSDYSQERLDFLKRLPILKPEDVADAVGYVLSTPEHVQIRELIIAPFGE